MSDRLKGWNRRRADTLVMVGVEAKEMRWRVWAALAGETHGIQNEENILKIYIILMVNQ